MEHKDLSFDSLMKDITEICVDMQNLLRTPGPSRCVARLNENCDPRLGKQKEFPMVATINEILQRINDECDLNLQLLQDCGNIVIVNGAKDSLEEIREIPVTLTSHADEITFLRKKNSQVLFPLCNTKPFAHYGVRHHEAKSFGFRGKGGERVFREIGTAELHQRRTNPEEKTGEPKFEYYLKNETGEKPLEGDLVILNYNFTKEDFGPETIFHSKALDDRVGVLSNIYTMKELAKANVPAKAILVGDEEGVDAELSWARLARPSFAKYCQPDGITILCDGFDGKKLSEFSKYDGSHLDIGLVVPYRSEGKGAGDPGIFSLMRDEAIPMAEEHGFKVATTTDYVSRSLDPKIMDDFPYICSIDWSNGPVISPIWDDTKSPNANFFNVCHVDESVAIKQAVNIVGATYWTVSCFNKKMKTT